MFWSDSPPAELVGLSHRPLRSADIREICTALESLGIPCQPAQQQVLVDSGKLHQARIELARRHLPKLERTLPRVPLRSPMEEALRQREAEKSLTLTVRWLPGVEDAYVKIAMPEAAYYLPPDRKPTGRMLLKPEGEIDIHLLAHLHSRA